MRKVKMTPLFFLIVLLMLAFSPCAASSGNLYIGNPSDFQNALKKGQSVIYVDDVYFEKETQITLNYNVKIVGKTNKSRIKNACFSVVGSNVDGKNISVSFENIILDGNIDKKNYDFSVPGKKFGDIFGNERSDKHAIYGTWGYFTITLDNCEICKYASYIGPAIYVDNNETFHEYGRTVNLKNTKIHDNICYHATVCLFHDKGIYNIQNCSFSQNLSKSSGGADFANGTATVENSDFCHNDFYRFVDTNPDGTEQYPDDIIVKNNKNYHYVRTPGALFIGAANARVRNCRISDNKGLYGGGVGVTSPPATGENEKVEFVNCIISNNSAQCGGAIYAKSLAGHNINFINCIISGNKAENGGIIYTTTLVPYTNDTTIINGGNISFVFCSMAENTDTDGASFGFYSLKMARFAGHINPLGCFVVYDTPYRNTEGYNYIAERDKAFSDGAINDKTLGEISKGKLSPIEGSIADISVSPDVYSEWSDDYKNATAPKKIGAVAINNCGYTEKQNSEPTTPSGSTSGKNESTDSGNQSTSKTDKETKSSEGTLKSSEDGETDTSESDGPDKPSATNSVSSDIQNKTEKTGISPLWFIIPIVILLAGGGCAYGFFVWRKKKEKSEPKPISDFSEISFEELTAIVSSKFKDRALTNKEIEVATLLLTCKRRKDIAEKLVVSEDTVKTHISHIFKKVGVSSKEELKKKMSE